MTNAADDDPWYSALSAAFKKHNLEVLMMMFIKEGSRLLNHCKKYIFLVTSKICFTTS